MKSRLELAAVVKTGQRVELSHMSDLIEHHFLGGDVEFHAEYPDRTGVLAFARRGDPYPTPVTLGRDDLGVHAETAAVLDRTVSQSDELLPRFLSVEFDDFVAL